MIHDLSDLPAILSATPCSLSAWVHSMGAALLSLLVLGLEIWLRVPVRPVFDQFAIRRPAPARPDAQF